MEVTRNYKAKDVEMLITSSTIIDSAIAHKEFLQSKRPLWTAEFFDTIKANIDNVVQNYLGQDNVKDLRAATRAVQQVLIPSLKDLAEFKVQIDADFAKDKVQQKEILTTLGFNAYYENARKKDQEAVIDLLYQFKTNMRPDLKQAIIEKGTAPELIAQIINYADKLKDNNVLQEGKKGSRKEVTQDAIAAFNSVYDEVIAVAKISAKFFKDKPSVKEQFSFSKVKGNLNNTKKKTEPNT